MDYNNSPATPISPRRYLCDLDYSKLGEQLNEIENRQMNSNSDRELYRYQWLQLIVKLNKNESMQPVFKYLKDEGFIQNVKNIKKRVFFNKMKKELLRKKWRNWKTQIINNNIENKAVKVKSVRIKHASLYLTSNIENYILADFSNLVNVSVSKPIESIQSLKFKPKVTIISKSININNNDKTEKKSLLRMDALKLYAIFILLGLLIGCLLYRNFNKKLYNFIKMEKENRNDFNGFPQNSVIKDSLLELKKASENV